MPSHQVALGHKLHRVSTRTKGRDVQRSSGSFAACLPVLAVQELTLVNDGGFLLSVPFDALGEFLQFPRWQVWEDGAQGMDREFRCGYRGRLDAAARLLL
jgi:hypothetical protein